MLREDIDSSKLFVRAISDHSSHVPRPRTARGMLQVWNLCIGCVFLFSPEQLSPSIPTLPFSRWDLRVEILPPPRPGHWNSSTRV